MFEGALLDMWRVFQNVWHEDIIFNLKQNDVSGMFLNLLSNFLRNKQQRLVLNVPVWTWTNVNAGVPWGSSYEFYHIALKTM